jgi:hypothetical protein
VDPPAAVFAQRGLPTAAATVAGAAFLTALGERPADRVRPVPAAFAPLVHAIAGPRPVAVRTGAATTRALRRANKQAATVDNVVHLAAPPESSPPSVEVFAHELVHAARPSPVPRFFDDDHHSPEEELARATGKLLRAVQPAADATSTALPLGTAGLPVGAGAGMASAVAASGSSASTPPAPPVAPAVIRRSLARTAAERRTSRTRDREPDRSLPTSSGGGSSGESAVIRRSLSPGTTGRISNPGSTIFGGSSADMIIRRVETGDSSPASSPTDPASSVSPIEAALTTMVLGGVATGSNKFVGMSGGPIRTELITQIVDALEERVIAELERRGRRHNPGVF